MKKTMPCLIAVVLILSACVVTPVRDRQVYQRNVTVIVTTQEEVQREWQRRGETDRVNAFVSCTDASRTVCQMWVTHDVVPATVAHEFWGHLMKDKEGNWNIPDGK